MGGAELQHGSLSLFLSLSLSVSVSLLRLLLSLSPVSYIELQRLLPSHTCSPDPSRRLRDVTEGAAGSQVICSDHKSSETPTLTHSATHPPFPPLQHPPLPAPSQTFAINKTAAAAAIEIAAADANTAGTGREKTNVSSLRVGMGRTGSGRWAFLNVLKVIFFFFKTGSRCREKDTSWGMGED